MLPVMKKGKLIGIVTDRDLKKASASDATTLEVHELLYLLTKIKVKDIMTRDVITVPPDYTVEETAQVLQKNRISGAPVVDADGQLVGTITQTDLFKVLISLTGVGSGGIQFGFLLENRPGSIKEVADVIHSFGGRMVSILTSYAAFFLASTFFCQVTKGMPSKTSLERKPASQPSLSKTIIGQAGRSQRHFSHKEII